MAMGNRRRLIRWPLVAFGLLFIFLGAKTLHKQLYMWGDVPIPQVTGWLEIPVGIWILYIAIWGHRPYSNRDRRDTMCPGCQRVFPGPQAPSECPECRLLLEPIKGFYKRHPELKREGEPKRNEPKT